MGRTPRITEPRTVYHLLNRRIMRLFEKDAHYRAFERVLGESPGDLTLRSPGRPRRTQESS